MSESLSSGSPSYHTHTLMHCVFPCSTSPDTGAGGQGSLDKLKRRHDSESYSLVKLKNGMVLYSRALLSGISCVCLLKSEDSFDRQLGIIDYNAFILKDAVQQVYELAIQM